MPLFAHRRRRPVRRAVSAVVMVRAPARRLARSRSRGVGRAATSWRSSSAGRARPRLRRAVAPGHAAGLARVHPQDPRRRAAVHRARPAQAVHLPRAHRRRRRARRDRGRRRRRRPVAGRRRHSALEAVHDRARRRAGLPPRARRGPLEFGRRRQRPQGSAFDRAPPSTAWLGLYRGADKAPMRWLVDGAHGQAVAQLPDRRAVYDIYVTPNGYIVDNARGRGRRGGGSNACRSMRRLPSFAVDGPSATALPAAAASAAWPSRPLHEAPPALQSAPAMRGTSGRA